MEKISICPQTIFKFKSSDEEADEVLSNLKKEQWTPTASNLQTPRNESLHYKENYATIHEWFTECLTLVKDELNYACESIRVTQSWGNLSCYDQWHHMHMHPTSLMSGFYYPMESVAPIEFGVRNIWNFDYMTGGLVKLSYEDYDTMTLVHRYLPQKGDLLIFPSMLNHMVPGNKGKDRYSLSFNSWPHGMIGSPDWLSSIRLNII